jgi:regulation of enolase protein 1 (concanavalin A-like superfamily)
MSSFSVVVEEPLQFALEPVSLTVEEGGTARFTALAIGRGPYTYQWLRDGADIVGATAAAYAIPNVPLTDNGATFACRIGNIFGDSVTSSNALLTVVQDVNKPVAYAVGSLHGTGIGVYFSDLNRLEPVSATDLANYTVNGGAVTVTGATLERDNLAVMLSLSAPITGPFSVEIKNVSDAAPTTPNVMNTVTLQSTVVTWPVSQDVGTLNATPPPAFSDPVMPGFAQAIGTDGFYVHAGGHDIWDAADGLHFVQQPVTGDFDVAVQVAGLLRPNEWAKAGLMVREDLDAGSRNFLIAATPTDGMNLLTVQWRLEKGLATASLADALRPRPSPIPNAWLRLTRSGQVFTCYHGTNGTDWVNLYTTNLTATPYPATVYVGLATTSHNNGALVENTTDAYFRNLTGLPFSASAPVTLKLGLSGNNVVISWTSAEAGLQLQSTGSLLPVNWQPVGTAPVADGDTYTVTIPLTAEPRFFRLVR